MQEKLFFASKFLFLIFILTLSSCKENIYDEEEYIDWEKKNKTAFLLKLQEAKDAIAQAQTAYGDEWETKCPWRVYRTYAQDETVGGDATDSICMKMDPSTMDLLGKDHAGITPYYTDSVNVNYMLRLQPSTSYPEGKIVDFSGPLPTAESVFHPNFCSPTKFLASNTVEGFTTALLHMKEGERWMVYVPQQLGYAATATTTVPAYSMLTFDLQLVKVFRQ